MTFTYRNHQTSVETLFTKVAATIDDCLRVLLKLDGTPSQRPKGNLPLIEDYRFSMECDGSFNGDMFLQGLDSYQGWMGALSGSWACSLRGGKGCVWKARPLYWLWRGCKPKDGAMLGCSLTLKNGLTISTIDPRYLGT